MNGGPGGPDTGGATEGPDASGPPDEELMSRAARGDDDAFCALVLRHERPLANFFARNGVDTDVEDLVQRTFLKLHGARGQYRPTAKFTTFLYLVARRTMIDAARAARRREDLLARAALETETAEDAPRNRGEGQDALAALAALPPAFRETVVLVVMQGLAYAEAAEVLGVPLGTVKSRIHEALSRMRKELSK